MTKTLLFGDNCLGDFANTYILNSTMDFRNVIATKGLDEFIVS